MVNFYIVQVHPIWLISIVYNMTHTNGVYLDMILEYKNLEYDSHYTMWTDWT